MKYICAFLLLLGTSAHAWASCDLYGGVNGNTKIATIADDATLSSYTNSLAVTGWTQQATWTTEKYEFSYTNPSSNASYTKKYDGQTPGGVSKLYAVYQNNCGYAFSGSPYVCYELALDPTTGSSYAAASKYCYWQAGNSVTITAYPASGKVVTNWEVLNYNTSGAITPTSTTATTFTFTMPASDVVATVTFGDACTEPTVEFADDGPIYKKTSASNFTNAATVKVGGVSTGQTITYSSSNTDVATINPSTGEVTVKAVGSTTITASVSQQTISTTTYCAKSATYTLYVYTAPTVTNTNLAVSNITPTSATVVGGQVSSRNGRDISQYGWLLNTSSTVDKDNYAKVGGYNANPSLNTNFASKSVTGLTAGTTYYVRPYATNGAYGYGPSGTIVSFTTPYLITLDKNGGDADGSAYVLPNATTLTNISEPTKTGYHVEGYYTTSGVATKVATDEGALQASIEVSSTEWTNSSSQWKRGAGEKFYAKWTANEYTVTLDPNGGSGSNQTVTATYGSAMPGTLSGGGDIVIPTKSGYDFAGYYYGETKYYNTDGSSAHNWDIANNTTLTARWETVSPTITIVANSHVTISSTTPSIAAGSSSTYTAGNPVTLSHGDPSSGYYWLAWDVYETGNTSNKVSVNGSNQFTMPTHNVTVTAKVYTSDIVFSCSELTLTAHPEKAGAPIFITSVANKKVRSQGYITITGNGLTPSTALTFPGLNSKFEVLTSTGGTISTDASGAIDVNAYIFYTPGADETTDGLLKITGITVAVGGDKPKQKTLTYDIIGRHLPTAGYVIAGKKDNKWYALPSNMASTSTPAPSEIAVDDLNNPTIAYTDASNIYGLEGPTTSGGGNNIASGYGQYVRLTMSIESSEGSGNPAPLFGTSGAEDASSSPKVGKSGNAIATNNLSAGYWWELKQTNTSISNPQDAKYMIKCANNNHTLSIKNNPFVWGLYASGVEELRLIPASDIPFTEAYFVEWGQHGGVIEVDATGIDATSVVAHLGMASSSATLSQTQTSGGKASKYNYTVNFGDGIDFAASTSNGALLMLDWKKGEIVKAKTSIVVPKIIASNATMSSLMPGDAQWETEVHVLPDVTLTANAGDFLSNDVMIKQLEIYPGATVVVTKGSAESGTLKVKTLVLRNGWTCASGSRKYDVARLYITPTTANLAKNAVDDVWYADWYIDFDQYYPIAVPWKVAVNSSNIVHRYTSNTATFGPSGSIRLRYYDGEQRATSGQSMIGQNWKDYGKSGNLDLPAYLEPSKGYSFSAKRPSGKAFSIVRMTLGIPSNDWTALGEQGEVSGTHKDQVSVTGWGKGTADWYAMGWNFIGNPYMCTFNGDDGGISGKLELQNGGSIKYATIPSIDFSNYDQVAIADADLKPARGFFIQANNAEAQNITFNASKIVDPTAAPARYMTQTEAIPEQEAYIRLSYEGGKDQMGLIIGEDYTEAYEVNADLAKVLGDAGFVKTYMQYGGMDMAYVAINQELAKAWIPVTVILPKDGEYTFSLMSSSEVEQLEGVYLIDYAENETVTNLIDKDYTFVADAATISNRFAINAIIGERQTPTDIDVINEGGDLNSDRPFKFLYRDKVYIYHRGVIYDATGKKVREINK